MMYLSQFLIILGFTLMGEALQRFLPLPIPASVCGLVLLFAALCCGIVKVSQVRQVGSFLTGLLPLLFVAPSVGIVEHWQVVKPHLLPICLFLAASTVLTFGISGRLTQWLLRKKGGSHG